MTAYAIDPETAHTALSSHTNRHILLRYGTLFASSFMTGFGNAFQSAGTTVTVGTDSSYTVEQNTANSALENAVIALADVGKAWGQAAQQNINMPPTVYVYSGTGIGILFTSDLMSL
jgi:intracellular multiplication protein IcmE